MTETLLLVGRETDDCGAILDCHARRLRDRGAIETVRTVQYADDPEGAVAEAAGESDADTVYVLPAETRGTGTTAVGSVDGTVQICEPIGRSPLVTSALLDRAGEHVSDPARWALVLVGSGGRTDSARPAAIEHHAGRLRRVSEYSEVAIGYLAGDPALECVPYRIESDRAVAVPFAISGREEAAGRIDELLGQSGFERADPPGDHEWITDAIEAELARQRHLAASGTDHAHVDLEPETDRRLVADGTGRP